MRPTLNAVFPIGIGLLIVLLSFACGGSQEAGPDQSRDSTESVVRSISTEGARIFISEPADGAVVTDSFLVKFGIDGMKIAPAGSDVPDSGHFHLLVDADELPAFDQPMGKDILHFGKGQTETWLALEPGEHTLRLILGDGNHVPHDPPVISEKIHVTVQ